MKNITIARNPVNESALHENLLLALGSAFIGLSTTPQEVVVHLQSDASLEILHLAQTIVEAHNPALLTQGQSAELARKEALAELNLHYSPILEMNDFVAETDAIQELAARIRRLELLLGGA